MLRPLEDKIIGEMTDHERSVVRHGAAWFFLVLFSYYILRPIREQISATYGIKNLEWLFMATFGVMLVAIPLFAFLVGHFHRRKLVPCIYIFFCLCLGGFWFAFTFAPQDPPVESPGENTVAAAAENPGTEASVPDDSTGEPEEAKPATPREWIARALFIWISVYGLFIVSFFWSVMGDLVSTDQGRRLFGFVFGAGTAGGMVASAVTGGLVERMGQANLLILPAVALATALVVYFSLERSHKKLQPASSAASSGKATGGNPFAGFIAVFSSRYLFAIGMYGLLLATCGTTIYFQQSEIVGAAFKTDETKTAFFANVNLWVQIVTIVLQTAVVGRLMKHLGLGLTLAILPLCYVLGITSLALTPTITVLAIISVTGRSAEYAIANPAREVLYAAVNREDRYKAKSFIDTIVRRGGDTFVGSAYRSLRQSLGVAMTTLSWVVLPIALVWMGLAVFIGRENKKIASHAETDRKEPTPN